MPWQSLPPLPWLARLGACFLVLSLEAFSIRSTGIKQDIWTAGSLLVGGNQFFRLFILPFLFTLVYVGVLRLRGGQFRGDFPSRPHWSAIATHVASLTAFLLLTRSLLTTPGTPILSLLWFAIGVATAVTGILVAFGSNVIARSTLPAALITTAFALFSIAGIPFVERAWNYDSNVTVRAATALLQHFGFAAHSQGKIIRIPHFAVIITPACSGYEGICLFLMFAAAWLIWYRKEFRFPAALLVLPIGAAVSWGLNVVRIAGYVLIGHYGHRDIAMNGFHSWAGLISFSVLALSFCAVTPRVPGISIVSATPKPAAARTAAADPIFWYLLPFLAMQAASMLSKASSAGMEWLYPLRVLAAAAAIWPYRKKYAAMDWLRKPSLFAIATAAAATIIWIFFSARLPYNPGPMPHLQSAPLTVSIAWLSFRVIGGVLAAPFVEELAFRGFLLRRIQSPEFASLDPRRCGWLAIAISSAVFGLLHGSQFIPGTIAGALFAAAYIRSGKLGDSVAAHALTNLLLAVVVAGTGDWRYW